MIAAFGVEPALNPVWDYSRASIGLRSRQRLGGGGIGQGLVKAIDLVEFVALPVRQGFLHLLRVLRVGDLWKLTH